MNSSPVDQNPADQAPATRPFHTSVQPDRPPFVDEGLGREISRQFAAEDEPTVTPMVIEALGAEDLPREGLITSWIAFMVRAATHWRHDGTHLLEHRTTGTEVDLVHATNELTDAQTALARSEQEHDEALAVYTGQVPDAEGIAWTNGDPAAVRDSVDGRGGRRGTGKRREGAMTAGALALLFLAEFSLSYSIWWALLGAKSGDVTTWSPVIAFTVLTVLSLTLLPHALVPHMAMSLRSRRPRLGLLWLLLPVLVAILLAIARQYYYIAIGSSSSTSSGAGVAESASGDAQVELYSQWWMAPLFVIVLLFGIAWLAAREAPRYNPHTVRYARAYRMMRLDRERVERAQRAIVEAEGALKSAEIAQRHHDAVYSHLIGELIPSMDDLLRDEYAAELVRIKADPAFTAAMAVKRSERQARLASPSGGTR